MSTSSNDKNERIETAALTIFFRIAEKWELTLEEQRVLLGNPEEAVFSAWQSSSTADTLPQDILDQETQ